MYDMSLLKDVLPTKPETAAFWSRSSTSMELTGRRMSQVASKYLIIHDSKLCLDHVYMCAIEPKRLDNMC